MMKILLKIGGHQSPRVNLFLFEDFLLLRKLIKKFNPLLNSCREFKVKRIVIVKSKLALLFNIKFLTVVVELI